MTRPFNRVARAEAQPGHCLRCPRNEDLFDLGAEPLQNYGVAYLCSVCMGELMDRMEVVTSAVFQGTVTEYGGQIRALQDELALAAAANGAPTAAITLNLKEFSDGVAALARVLVHNLASVADGSDRVAVAPAEPAEPARADVPVEPAAEPAGADDSVSDDDAGGEPEQPAGDGREDLLRSLGFPGTAPRVDAAEPAGDAPAPHIDDLRIDPFELLGRVTTDTADASDDEPAGN